MTANDDQRAAVRPEKVEIETADGWRLHLHFLEPRQTTPNGPLLLVFPALAAPARIYVRMGIALAKLGYRVALVDPRGGGESGPQASRRVDYSIAQHLEYDWPAVIEWAKTRYPDAPRVALGHSLGGQLSAIYAGQHPGSLAAMVLLTVPLVWYQSWHFPSSIALWSVYMGCALTSRVLGYFPANRLGLGQPVARMVMRDWTRWGLTGKFCAADGDDLLPSLQQVSGPVLCVSFTDDRFYAPRTAVDAFADLLTQGQVARWHLSPADLGVNKLGHFRYLRNTPELWERIHRWLEASVPRTQTLSKLQQ